MKISQSLLNSFLGLAVCVSLSSMANAAPAASQNPAKEPAPAKAPAAQEHKHAEGEECTDHDHAKGGAEHAEHKHAEGDVCTEHDQAAHKHAEGETCEDHDHDGHIHAEGEECTDHDHAEGGAAHEGHKHADGEACTDQDHAGHNHAEGETCTADSTGEEIVPVKIDDKARISLDMQVETVVNRPHEAGKTFYGQLEIPPHAVKTYALASAGKVNLQVRSAQAVKKGDLLYTLESPEIVDLQGKVAEGEAALNRNTLELETLQKRQQQLSEIGTKNSELETNIRFKEAEKPGLEAALESARNKLKLAVSGGEMKGDTLYVQADRDGSVQSVDINQGAWGELGNPVLVLTHKGELEFKTTAFASDSLQHSQVRLALPTADGKETQMLDGKLRVSAQIDPEKQTRILYFVPDRLPETAYAGQLARLEMNAGQDAEDGYIPVPNSAVVKVGVNDVVFIQDNENKNLFLMKKVTTLPARRGMTPVKGVVEGQTIVTKGGYELKYALPAQGGGEKKAAGHFHADGKFHEGEH